MTEARHSTGGPGEQRTPALRGDLRVTNMAGQTEDVAMRVFDPKSGRSHGFDRREQMLYRAADGASDLAAIHARQKALGGDMTEDEVARFFRKLHVLGLLKPGQTAEKPAAADDATDKTRDLIARRRKEQSGATGRDGGLMARRRLGQGPVTGAAAGAPGKMPGGMRKRLNRRATPRTGTTEGEDQPPRRGAGDLLARRREEMAAREAAAEAETPPVEREGRASSSGLLAKRREELAARDAAAEAPAPPAERESRASSSDLLAKRREEMAAREAASEAPEPEAKREGRAGSAEVPSTPAKEVVAPEAASEAPEPEAKREGEAMPADAEASQREDAASETTDDGRAPSGEPLPTQREERAASDTAAPEVRATATSESPAASNGDAVAPAEKAPSESARALLARRRAEAAGQSGTEDAETAAETPRDLLAERRAEIGRGGAGAASRRDLFTSHGQRPAATPGARDLLAGPRAALAGATALKSEEPKADTVDVRPDEAAAVSPPRATEAQDDERPSAPRVQTVPAAAAPRKDGALTEAPASPGSPSAAMSAAKKAAEAGTPRAKPSASVSASASASARASGAKKPPRNSDLMVRRLRERSGRGIAPETGKPADPAQIEAATRRPAATPATDPDLDFDFMDDDDLGGMGGLGGMAGPGGGMGGMRGGIGGGMRAGMAGGGMMGAGGMGGMAGRMGGGALAGMRGGMGAMGGGMAGRMGGQPQAQPQKMPAQLPLFHPQAFLRLLYVLFYPMKYVLWAIVPLVGLAVMTVANNLPALIEDLVRLSGSVTSIGHLLISIFGVSLMARLAQGVAIVAHGGRVKVFGLMLALGIIPRFVIERSGIDTLDRKGQLWAHAAPLLTRLTVFAVGILIWEMTRDRGGPLPDIALILAQFGLVVFILTAWPLFMSDGQRWLALMLNEPKLVGKSLSALRYVFKGGELRAGLSRKDVWPLTLFALGNILTIVILVGAAIYVAATTLVGQFAGLGFVLFAAGLTSFSLWVAAVLANRRKNRGQFDAEAFRKFAGMRGGFLQPEPDPADAAAAESVLPSRAKVVWAMVLCGLIAVAFLPYRYQTGGDVEILPLERGQAVARSEGELVGILVREGDAVERGQTLARLSSWDQQAQVRTTEAQLEGAQAKLQRLENGATPEEIEVARKELESAEASVTFRRAEAQRNAELARTGVVSRAALEKSQSELEIDLADLEVARANYNRVAAPATAEDLAIARSDVRRLEEQLRFDRDELERTKIVAPIAGRVVTPNLQLKQGSYLRSGDVLLEIERTDKVTATILVTEADIGLIQPGDEVRLKIASLPEQQIVGQVEAIAPSATDEAGYGKSIRVTASFDNSDGFLRTGMTGYAKIDGEEMRVWEAYLRSIRHFFQIEVWSWIP